MRQRLIFQTLAVGLTLLGSTAILALILGKNDGMFTYVLDDPYIHMAVAESILDGSYGINATEHSAPSSSILYPLIIAATFALGLSIWGPLIICVCASCASSWLIAGAFWSSCISDKRRSVVVAGCLVLPILLLSANLIAIPFTGMEHALHILATIMVAVGVIHLPRAQHTPKLLIAGLILCPLLRFEGLATALAGLLVLLVYRRFLAALFVTLMLVAALGTYIFTMASLDLPWLPSSVLVKSSSSAAVFAGDLSAAIVSLVVNLLTAFNSKMGILLALGAAFALFSLSLERPSKARRALVFLSVAIALAHMTAGRFGWFGRYEVYAVAFLIVALLHLYGSRIFPDQGNVTFGAVGLIAVFGTVGSDYVWRTAVTPSAAHGIYGQHYQMHRFATDYFPYTVAANDIGYTSYDNANYVLDLWGLGSEDVRRARASGTFNADFVEHLANQKDVQFAMVYEDWIGTSVPSKWCKIATIENYALSAARNEVVFYLRDLKQEQEMRAALDAFGNSLPASNKLTVFPEC